MDTLLGTTDHVNYYYTLAHVWCVVYFSVMELLTNNLIEVLQSTNDLGHDYKLERTGKQTQMEWFNFIEKLYFTNVGLL